MSKKKYFSTPTAHSEFSIPNHTSDIEKVNFVYVNPDIKKPIKKYEKPLLKIQAIRKSYIDSYQYICGAINHLSHVDKRYKDCEYIPLNYEILASILNEKKIKEFISNLIEWGVIETDGRYQPGVKSKGYKLLSPYNRNTKKIMVKDSTINRKLNEYKIKEFEKILELPYPYQYLEWTNTWIDIDATEAKGININSYWGEVSQSGELNKQYESNYFAIMNYSTGDYRFNVDDFGNRVHTNLTNLNKDFRYTLSVQGHILGQIDVKNSQPLFFYKLIEHETDIPAEEKQKYKKLVESGKFYEYFMDHFNIPEHKREEKKQNILTGLFSDKNRATYSRYFEYFRKDFPHIAKYILKVKTHNMGIKEIGRLEHYKNLICLMQREETKFMIEKVVATFISRYEGQFIATIHDSIVVKTEMLETVKEIMLECFRSEGLNPKLKIEIFSKGSKKE